MSRQSFTRTFHRETGLSLSTAPAGVALFTALPRLADGEPITSVALDLGYDSVPAFLHVLSLFDCVAALSLRSFFEAGSRYGRN